MRRKLVMFYVFILVLLVIFQIPEVVKIEKDLSYILLSSSYLGIENPVTGIYLYFRLFDTLFEALLLLTSVIAIIYFSRNEGDIDEEKE